MIKKVRPEAEILEFKSVPFNQEQAMELMDKGSIIVVLGIDWSDSTVFAKDLFEGSYRGCSMYFTDSSICFATSTFKETMSPEKLLYYTSTDCKESQVMSPDGWWGYFRKDIDLNRRVLNTLVYNPQGNLKGKINSTLKDF